MYILTRFILVLVVVLGVSHAYAMRCGNDIINTGDSTQTLIQKCGQPQFKVEDFFKDRAQYMYYMNDGSVYTVVTLKNIITDIDMDRQ